MTGGPPLLFASAAHVENIPEMKWQGLIGGAQIWRTSVVVEQRSADSQTEKKQIYTFSQKFTKNVNTQLQCDNTICWRGHTQICDSFSDDDLMLLVLHCPKYETTKEEMS